MCFFRQQVATYHSAIVNYIPQLYFGFSLSCLSPFPLFYTLSIFQQRSDQEDGLHRDGLVPVPQPVGSFVAFITGHATPLRPLYQAEHHQRERQTGQKVCIGPVEVQRRAGGGADAPAGVSELIIRCVCD